MMGWMKGALTVDCPAGAPAATAVPAAPAGRVPSGADGSLFLGDYLLLRKRRTPLRDGVLSACPATAALTAPALSFHGPTDPAGDLPVAGSDGETVYWSFPPEAVALNGVPCAARGGGGANVTVEGYYDSPGEPAVGVEGHTSLYGEASLTCGRFSGVSLQWFSSPRCRVALMFLSQTVQSADSWSCDANRGLWECVHWRPLCQGGQPNFKGPP